MRDVSLLVGLVSGWLAWALPPLLLVAAAWVWRWSRRGARGAGTGPHCRRCGYDLTGLPAGRVCPECGNAVAVAGNVTVGRPRPRVVRIAPAALAGIAVVAGVWVYVRPKAPTAAAVWRVTPEWVVVAGVRNGLPDAAREAAHRLDGNTLGVRALAAMVDPALAFQADHGRPWEPAFGTIAEFARGYGFVCAARWERYAANAPAIYVAKRGFRLLNALDAHAGEEASFHLVQAVPRVDGWGSPRGTVHRRRSPAYLDQMPRLNVVVDEAGRSRTIRIPNTVPELTVAAPWPEPGDWYVYYEAVGATVGGMDTALALDFDRPYHPLLKPPELGRHAVGGRNVSAFLSVPAGLPPGVYEARVTLRVDVVLPEPARKVTLFYGQPTRVVGSRTQTLVFDVVVSERAVPEAPPQRSWARRLLLIGGGRRSP